MAITALFQRGIHKLFILGLIAVLAACGGGGGGGETEKSSGFSISFNTSTISMTAVKGSNTANTTTILATGNGQTTGTLYLNAKIDGSGIQAPIVININEFTNSATINVVADTSLAVGTYTGTLTLYGCKDAGCVSNFKGSPHTVSYTIKIVDPLKVSPASVELTQTEATAGNSSSLKLTLPSNSIANTTITYIQGQDWLTLDNQGGNIVLTADARGLFTGTYNANVQVKLSNPEQIITVPVTLAVEPGLVTPAKVEMTLTGTSVAGDMTGSFVVAGAAQVVLPNWSATSNVPWLVLDKNTGTAGQRVTWHLNLGAVSALQNLTSITANIVVTAGANISSQTTMFTLNMALPEIVNIDRLALLSNQPGNLMVYGSGFSSMANPMTDIHISGASLKSVSVLSDRALQIALPALAAGNYDLTVTNGIGFVMPPSKLSVLNPIDRPYQVINTMGDKKILLWDNLTQSAFTINQTLGSIMRFDLSGASATVSARSVSAISIGLPLNHSALLAIQADGTLLDLKTTDLSTAKARNLGTAIYDTSLHLPLPITGDNLMWLAAGNPFTSLLAFDLNTNKPVSIPYPANTEISFYYGPWAAVSPDGRRMMMTQQTSTTAETPMLFWDTAEGKLNAYTGADIRGFYRYSTSHDGQRWNIDGYWQRGFDLGKLGQIVLPQGWYSNTTVTSRDGKFLYVYALNERAIGTYSEPSPTTIWPRIYVFDLTEQLVTKTDYSILGYIELSDYPACQATQGPEVCSAYSVELAITDDDRTILALGDRRLVVVPVPSIYRSN